MVLELFKLIIYLLFKTNVVVIYHKWESAHNFILALEFHSKLWIKKY